MKKSVRTFAFTLFIASLFLLNAGSASAAYSINGATASGGIGVATPIPSLQITGTGTEPIPVKLLVTSGTLQMSTTTGLTFDGSQTGSSIYFSGSLANVNAALATLTYTRNSAGSDTLEVSLVNKGEVFFTDNNHLYEYVADSGTWDAAKVKAEALTRYGATGYLATITSANENAFIAARLLGEGWMGASDAAVEGDWKWATGPEAGTSFWLGAGNGNTVNGGYANWNNNEPNQSGNEDCGQLLVGGGNSGKWNDLTCAVAIQPGFVVEFGAPSALPTVAGQNFSITTVANPVISSVSPADNSTNIAINTTLSATFSNTVVKGTGSIVIKKTSDNSTVETIAVGSSQVAGAGTNTIVITPSSLLAHDASYYVLIDTTAFKDNSNNFFGGIAATTTWNFRTIKSPQVIAFEKIQAYADSDGASSAPTVSDYSVAGITDVTPDTLGVANTTIAATSSANIQITSQAQILIAPVVATQKINLFTQSGGATATPTVSDFTNAGITGVTDGNIQAIIQAIIQAGAGQTAAFAGLQAVINAKIAQVDYKPGQTTGGWGGVIMTPIAPIAVPVAPQTSTKPAAYVRDLTVGSKGEDVKSLQKLLNAQGFTIAASGAGSPGNESTYFGTLTKRALARYQAKFGIKPAIGYFGSTTRAQMKGANVAGLWW